MPTRKRNDAGRPKAAWLIPLCLALAAALGSCTSLPYTPSQAKVEKLTNLINIFARPQLDFSQNRAEHDDILGDAYEYLMRHFATESGKIGRAHV